MYKEKWKYIKINLLGLYSLEIYCLLILFYVETSFSS